jgi:hypothetical protein
MPSEYIVGQHISDEKFSVQWHSMRVQNLSTLVWTYATQVTLVYKVGGVQADVWACKYVNSSQALFLNLEPNVTTKELDVTKRVGSKCPFLF